MRSAINTIALVGYACGLGAGNSNCAQGPLHLQKSSLLTPFKDHISWQKMLEPKQQKKGLEALPVIADLAVELAKITSQLVAENHFFVTIGGDHTCAIGTWSGVATAISPLPLGLLWIDAHLDSHTTSSTPSGNIHGMPLAALLGYGDETLTQVLTTQPKLLPQNVCIIGVRSFEPAEQELLEKLKVHVFYMDEVKDKGFDVVLAKAHAIITENTPYLGLSLDLDGIDPTQAPAVGSPEANGIDVASLYKGIEKLMEDPLFIAAEIAEYNPSLDQEHKTEKLICTLIEKMIQGLHKNDKTTT